MPTSIALGCFYFVRRFRGAVGEGWFAMRLPLWIIAAAMIVSALAAGGAAAETSKAASGSRNPTTADWLSRDFWQTTSGQLVPDGWQFTDGEVALVTPGKGGSIVTPPLPPHFELSWEWQIEQGVNSGLKYRVRRFGKDFYFNRYLGLEYQIIDSAPGDTSKDSTAAIYGLVGPAADKLLHPPGQWNSSRIIAVGDRIEHHLNGTLVAAAVTAGPAWETAVALSKFSGSSDFGRGRPGDRIMLTDHGGRVRYRNFQFVTQPAPLIEPIKRQGPFLAHLSRNGHAAQSSVSIWTRTTRLPALLAGGTDSDTPVAPQLPTSRSLDETFEPRPGAPGRVRLSFYPAGKRHQLKHAEWKQTVAAEDYTAQWKLEGLTADTHYVTVIEAQTPEGEPSAVMLGGFQTPPWRE